MEKLKQKILSLTSNNKTITNEQLCELLMTENVKLSNENIISICAFIEKEKISLISEKEIKKYVLEK